MDLRVELGGREVVVDDVSATGMFVSAVLPVGDEVEIGLGEARARARVVHRDGESAARPAGVGVAFERPTTAFLAAIERVIARARGQTSSGHVIVGDGESRVAERLSTALATAGFTVATATNGMEVLGACSRRTPSLLLVDRGLPTIDGHALMQRLACDVALAAVPVIVMSDSASEIVRAFDRGAADFVAKPFSTLEIVSRVRRLALATHPEHVVLSGNLHEIALAAVLTLLELERKSGRLVLKNGHTAWIDVVDGKIVDAGWSAADSHARNVVFSVLDWDRGTFKLVATAPRRSDPAFAMPITHLLLESARQRDELTERARSMCRATT